MHHKLHILKSVLAFLFIVGALFGALALLPAWAATPEPGPFAPDEPFAPKPGDVGAHLLVSSTTGYRIDDGWPGFSTNPSGPDGWLAWPAGGYDNDFLYTDATLTAGDWAKWKPDLAKGLYEVLVHYYVDSNHRDDAEYTVFYDGGSFTKLENQQAPLAADSGWKSLGVFPFAAGASGYVRLSDATTLGGSGTFVVADAVKFAPMEVWVDDSYSDTNCVPYVWGVTAFKTIQDGVQAVATNGTVHVGPNDPYNKYLGPITVTKSITLTSTHGAASTVISVTSGTAIGVLASGVTIDGLEVESSTAPRGIANYDEATSAWVTDVTDYRIRNNAVHGFGEGIAFLTAKGEISDNTIYNNSKRGILVQQFPSGVLAGPTTVSGNVLYGNGGVVADYDIQVHDSYTGTLITGNTIIGSLLGASEAGIYVVNGAGDLTLSANRITTSTYGVWIMQDNSGTNIIQKINLRGNRINGGTTGVRAERTGGSWSQRQIIIGGDLAYYNSLNNNSGKELELVGYSDNITATYNDWGVYTLRDIENEIEHDYDSFGLGEVVYEPALGVPTQITVEAASTSLPADGSSTATITATVRDVAGFWAHTGTMIGITTSLGSVPYGYVEENDAAVARTGIWTPAPDARASSGSYMWTIDAAATISWTFTAPVVSLIYIKQGGVGSANVYVDDFTTPITTINMSSLLPPAVFEYRVEDVITNALGTGPHTIKVTPVGAGPIRVDAFRSGGAVASHGRIVTTLTSATISQTATLWGTVYDGRIVTSTSVALYPIITATASVDFQGADAHISKSASPTTLNAGQKVTFTITYGNHGPGTATGAFITDTLPAGLVYVSSTPAYDFDLPNPITGTDYVWNVGSVAPGPTGFITVVAQPDGAMSWTTPVTLTNGAEISINIPDPVAGNNTTGAVNVTILPPAAVTITAHPPVIPVSSGEITTTLRITVTDAYSNLVDGATVNLTTTAGTLEASGGTTLTVTTTEGIGITGLGSGTTVTTATVTAAIAPPGGPTASVEVFFGPALPYTVTSTAYPLTVRVCGDTAVVTATIVDEYGNQVANDTDVQFAVFPAERGYMDPAWRNPLNGVATSTLHTGEYLFGAPYLTIKIKASRETHEALTEQHIDLIPGLPYSITFTASPPVVPVGGTGSEISALVVDCAGNAVQDGTGVTFTVNSLGTISPTTTTTRNGWAYTTFKPFCTVGTAVITATADSRSFTLMLTLEPGPADRISVGITPDTIQNCGGQAVIAATLYDRCNNLVKDGTTVTFGVVFDTVSVSPSPAHTINGQVTATVTALDRPLRTWPRSLEQIGVASGSAMAGFTNLWIVPGNPELVGVSADPGSIPINGDVNFYDVTIVARVADCSNTVVTDTTWVKLETDLGIFRDSGTRSVLQTTVSGLVTATLTSQSVAGTATITATADSAEGTTTVRFLPDEAYHVHVWGYPASIYADGTSTSLITAHVMDFWYNSVLDGITVTFMTNYGHFAETHDIFYTTTTTIEGFAFATLVAGTEPHTVLVQAVTHNHRIGRNYVYFIQPPVWGHVYLPIIKRSVP